MKDGFPTVKGLLKAGRTMAYNEGYKAGIKEVVDWINEHTNMPLEADFRIFFSRNDKGELVIGNHIDTKQWLTQLKEWGINP